MALAALKRKPAKTATTSRKKLDTTIILQPTVIKEKTYTNQYVTQKHVDMFHKFVQEQMKEHVKNTYTTVLMHGTIRNTGTHHFEECPYHGCHSDLPSLSNKQLVANGFSGASLSKSAQDFCNWIVSNESVYYPVIKYLGDDFHVVRDSDNNAIACFITNNNVNMKMLTNFFKSTRSVSEHRATLQFWEKWRMQRGKHPGLVFALMYFVSEKGDKVTKSHCCMDNTNELDLGKFVNNNHNHWPLNENTFASHVRYGGESSTLRWGSFPNEGVKSFNAHRSIKIIRKDVGKTRFFHLYNKEELNRYSDETLEYFFNEGYKEFVK